MCYFLSRYRILVEFQSRKAHCVQLKDKDILRILFFIVICVLGYLFAWTLADLDYASEGFSLVTNTSLKGLIQYPICKIKWWDYFIEIGKTNIQSFDYEIYSKKLEIFFLFIYLFIKPNFCLYALAFICCIVRGQRHLNSTSENSFRSLFILKVSFQHC